MRTRKFEVPKEMLGAFFAQVEESELSFELTEIQEDDTLEVKVSYEDSERDDIMTLVELIDDFFEDEEDEEDDQ